ncbi:expressed unknown protein [Seminavis robusta]|uniref:Uncharacterized protein n=1 Tax=Seminavis robusta TaxID=568900 RepID=A0A9N8HF31_9STRA|nr:expressed unknown protein [Seminavis robusta]|eukprot:Sro413_g138090.1 n/a (384) ;mRNA; f:35089-36240
MVDESSSESAVSNSSSLRDEPRSSSGAAPPVLNIGTDDDDNPPMPPRRQHKYTTADLQPERPWKRYCLICLAFLVMIAIMVLLSIFLQKLFDPPEDSDWSDDETSNTEGSGELTGESKLLPKGSDYLNDVCSKDRLDMANREACVQACAPSIDCCNPYATDNSTCFEQEVASCVTYSICHALDGFKEPPHKNLDRICSLDEVQASPVPCETACQSMQCCISDVDSCLSTSFQACLDYSSCQNLKLAEGSSNQYIAAAPSTLSEHCRDRSPQCIRDCKDGAACSDEQSAFFRDNFVACLTYASCNLHDDASTTRIKIAPIYSRVTEAPEDLKRVCLESYVTTTGPHECQQACATAECCFAEGSANCFGDDPLGCLSYQMCSVLQ